MASSRDTAGRYAERVKLSLARQRYLSEAAERALLLEGLDLGLSLDEARELLAANAAERGATREATIDHDIGVTVGAVAGAKGWINKRSFARAAELYQQLSGGAISAIEARRRIKALLRRHGWTVRGEVIFGTPHWLRIIAGR